MTNETIVECVKRVYRITVPGVATIEMENNKTLNVSDTVRLLQEELGIRDVVSVFRDLYITDVKVSPSSILELISAEDVEQPHDLRLLSAEDVAAEKDDWSEKADTGDLTEKDEKPDNIEESIGQNMLTPLERLNCMIQIEGEFIRDDYIRFLEEKKVEITKWMSYDDISRAMILKKIEIAQKKRPKEYVRYKVIDSDPINEDTYRQEMRKYKVEEKE